MKPHLFKLIRLLTVDFSFSGLVTKLDAVLLLLILGIILVSNTSRAGDLLSVDDGSSDELRTLYGEDQGVGLDAPYELAYLTKISVFGKRGGSEGYNPDKVFGLFLVLNDRKVVIKSFPFAYSLFPPNEGWISLEIPRLKVTKRFYIVLSSGSLPSRQWIGVGLDTTEKKGTSSYSTSVNKAYITKPIQIDSGTPKETEEKVETVYYLEPLKMKADWMIRAEVTSQEFEKSITSKDLTGKGFLYYDDGTPDTFNRLPVTGRGALVKFVLGKASFLDKVYIFLYGYGDRSPGTKKFAIYVQSEELQLIGPFEFDYSLIPDQPRWIELNMKGVKVPPTFHILAVFNSRKDVGTMLGVDLSGKNKGSSLGIPYKMVQWEIEEIPLEKVNWMIRAKIREGTGKTK